MVAVSGLGGPKADHLIERLLLGDSQRQAAKNVGIGERTVRRWVADPGFQRRLQEASEETIKQVRRAIVASTRKVTDTLVGVALGTIDADTTRVRAAQALLNAFVSLQPKQWQADVYTADAPVIDYRFEGIDPEVLR